MPSASGRDRGPPTAGVEIAAAVELPGESEESMA